MLVNIAFFDIGGILVEPGAVMAQSGAVGKNDS
jgi:hypothetical protein